MKRIFFCMSWSGGIGRAAVAGAFCAVLAGCGGDAPPARPEEKGSAVPVAVLTARTDVATSAEDAPGTVRPVETAMLSAKVPGTITEIDADPGRVVREGDLLARIDDREIKARLDNAIAALDQARKDFVRFEKLHRDRVITTQEFEAAQTRLRSAQAAEDEARTLLGYCGITAPFNGVVTRRLVQRGDLAVPGRALIEVENPGALRLEAQIPESLVGALSIGQSIAVVVDAADASLSGTVAEIAPASDPASRTTLVKIDLPGNPRLRSGQFGRARIPSPSAPRIRLPETVVFSRGQLDFVYVNDNGTARLRIVRTGRRADGKVEILSGLEPGESIVAGPSAVPGDGAPIAAAAE